MAAEPGRQQKEAKVEMTKGSETGDTLETFAGPAFQAVTER